MALKRCHGCGHDVPEGSNFCPACGRSSGDMERPEPWDRDSGWVDFIDRCWDFFASTKVASSLIVLIAVASIMGSLIEQENLYQDWRPPYLYYPSRYGELWGPLFMKLGLTHAYSSIWYASLILLCVISLIICSFHRLVPLYRVLQRPQIWKLPHFIHRQEVVYELEGDLAQAKLLLQKRGYNVRQERECLYADKGRISRYGPYVIHIGLILVAFAGFAKAIPGWDEVRDVWIADGQTVLVPDANFAITSYKFTMDLYPSGAPSRFVTDAGIVHNGVEVVRQPIEVNHPLPFDDWEVFQASWRKEPGSAQIDVIGAASGQSVKRLTVDLRQPQPIYQVTEQVQMQVESYFHDFVIDPQSKEPTNGSYEVKNPVLLVNFVDADTNIIGRAGLSIFGSGRDLIAEGPFALKVEAIEDRWYTGLKVTRDRTVPYMYTGLAVILIGMMITFFIFHWQVWVRLEKGRLLIGGRAYKNKFGLKQEFKQLFGANDRGGTLL